MKNKEPVIELIFPKPVYIIDDLIDENKLTLMENDVKNFVRKNKAVTYEHFKVLSTDRTNDQMHKEPEFKELSEAILKNVKNFMTALEYPEKFINECKFNNMWTNISQENDFVFPHHHMTFDKCIISGVFYVKSPPEAKIWFYKNHQIPTIKSHKYNHMTFEEYYFESEQNRLILFTSDFMHGNKTQPKGEKIAISFNVEY